MRRRDAKELGTSTLTASAPGGKARDRMSTLETSVPERLGFVEGRAASGGSQREAVSLTGQTGTSYADGWEMLDAFRLERQVARERGERTKLMVAVGRRMRQVGPRQEGC